ncbi:hypothetical protein [Rhodovulum visakhapatnamense]|uniref:Uncharacterized protein n=1 Tax=Rhodovulum visakhapatnamense TaxID=364297 RepID=A0A4R8FPG1_9RHOB|nr:hypothetical protein [Rhodovulum visakhapatnamense]TDX24171.1 hypothetical protein EV657_12467 [Rhodovulum visakhapatnamense]
MSTVRDDICEIAAEIGRGSDDQETIISPLYRRAVVDLAHGCVGVLIGWLSVVALPIGLVFWAGYCALQWWQTNGGSRLRDARVDFVLALIGLVAVKTGLLVALVLAPWAGALLAHFSRRTWR